MDSNASFASARQPRGTARLWNYLLTHPYREPAAIGLMAILVGAVGGAGAVVFRDMIRVFYALFHSWNGKDQLLAVFTPAAGLLLVGLVTQFFAREVKGHGVPQILESLALRGGKIRPRVAFFGILAPAITIGAGGSVGREGPIALIGGAFGSVTGQILRLPDKYTSLLLACGSAAGIAATFNAPIAGGFFGLEVILGTYALGAATPVFLSAVAGATIFDAIEGNHAVLKTAPYPVIHPAALFFMIVLGLMSGIVGIAYSKGLTWSEDLVQSWRAPFWMKAVTGGIFIGLIGLVTPGVLGVGYPEIRFALAGQFTLGTLLILLFFKFIATLTTISSGGSGGVFAPSLFLGAMLGGLYGSVLQKFVPGLIPHPQIYSIAGMGAIFAAAAQAPFVSITILLEVTGDYQLTPVVIAACMTAYVVHGVVTKDSMYTVKLARRGIRILRGNEVRPTERIPIEEAMEPLTVRLYPDDAVSTAYPALLSSKDHAAIVTEKGGHLFGVVTLQDLGTSVEDGRLDTTLREIALRSAPAVRPGQTLEEAMRLFSLHDLTLLPVVEPKTGEVIGCLTEGDAIRAYSRSTMASMESIARIQQLQSTHGSGQFVTHVVLSTDPIRDKTLSRIVFPEEAVVVSIQRNEATIIPHGNTELRENDVLLLFVSPPEKVKTVLGALRRAEPAPP